VPPIPIKLSRSPPFNLFAQNARRTLPLSLRLLVFLRTGHSLRLDGIVWHSFAPPPAPTPSLIKANVSALWGFTRRPSTTLRRALWNHVPLPVMRAPRRISRPIVAVKSHHDDADVKRLGILPQSDKPTLRARLSTHKSPSVSLPNVLLHHFPHLVKM
jgi:hypothetical protein